jgi:hypothetical protein
MIIVLVLALAVQLRYLTNAQTPHMTGQIQPSRFVKILTVLLHVLTDTLLPAGTLGQ